MNSDKQSGTVVDMLSCLNICCIILKQAFLALINAAMCVGLATFAGYWHAWGSRGLHGASDQHHCSLSSVTP
eukprot:5214978-Amphidinium_carterae.1